MFIDRPPFDPALGIALTRLLESLQGAGADVNVPDAVHAGLQFPEATVVVIPGTDQAPPMAFAYGTTWGLFFSAGVQKASQGTDLVNGYTTGNFGETPADINTYAFAIANALNNIPAFAAMLRMPNFLCAGHSLGGVICMAVGNLRNSIPGTTYSALVSFGAPRAGTLRLTTAFADWAIKRWMNDDDPVPLIPPTFSQSPALCTVVEAPVLRAWGFMAHTRGGSSLALDGTQTEAVLPQRAEMSPAVNLSSWLWGVSQGTVTAHRLDEYRRRLLLFQAQAVPPGNFPGHLPPPEVPVPEPLGEIRKEQAQFVQTRFNADRVPGGVGTLPAVQWFEKIKLGKVWGVRFGSRVFAIGPDRRRAGRLAQAGNIFLRRLLHIRAVDPDSFLLQWDEFLEAAQDPDSGIRPTMKPMPS